MWWSPFTPEEEQLWWQDSTRRAKSCKSSLVTPLLRNRSNPRKLKIDSSCSQMWKTIQLAMLIILLEKLRAQEFTRPLWAFQMISDLNTVRNWIKSRDSTISVLLKLTTWANTCLKILPIHFSLPTLTSRFPLKVKILRQSKFSAQSIVKKSLIIIPWQKTTLL